MRKISNVILFGLGAVGTIYADLLQNSENINFRVLVDEHRLERYVKNPIEYNGKLLNPTYVLPSETNFKADLVIIATKMSGLNDAIRELKNFVHENTIIISLLNGVESEKIIAEFYGREHLLYSYFIGHSSVRVGNKVTHDGLNTIVFGSDCPNDEENVRVLKEFFDRAGINYEIPKDIVHSLWLKFMLNVCANPTTALLRMNFGEMLRNKRFMELSVKIMKEVRSVAKAEGVNNTEIMVDETLASLKNMCPDGKTSMLQDIESGNKTEIDMFAGTVVRLGEKYGIQTPYCRFMLEMFEIIHENRDKRLGKVVTM